MTETAPFASGLPRTILTYRQIIACLDMGWGGLDQSTAGTMAAIAMAESSGNICAISPLASDNSRGYGLWQIEYPTNASAFPGGTAKNPGWISPVMNASMAMQMQSQSGYKPWSTYNNGSYNGHLLQAKSAATSYFSDRSAWSRSHAGGEAPNVNPTGGVSAALNSFAFQQIGEALWGQVAEISLMWATTMGVSSTVGATTGGIGNTAQGTAQALAQAEQGVFPAATEGSTGPLVRVLEVLLGSVLLAAGLYVITKPVSAPALKTAAKLVR